MPPPSATTFDRFDRVLGVLALRRAEDEQPPVPVAEIERADRGAQGRPPGAQLRRGRSHPQGSRARAASCSRTRASTTTVEDGSNWTMDAPDIKTPLPGPKAKAIIERDAQFVSPSYTRDYPFVIAAGRRAVVEDVDGNRFLDCAAGIAVNSTGRVASRRGRAPSPSRRRSSSTCRAPTSTTSRRCGWPRSWRAIAPIDGERPDVLRQLRHRDDRGGDQAGALPHEAAGHDRVPRRASTAARWARCR